MTRIFIHCVGSLRSLQTLDAAIPGFDRYPERALLLAGPGDLVCVGAPVDPEYLEFLRGLGLGQPPSDRPGRLGQAPAEDRHDGRVQREVPGIHPLERVDDGVVAVVVVAFLDPEGHGRHADDGERRVIAVERRLERRRGRAEGRQRRDELLHRRLEVLAAVQLDTSRNARSRIHDQHGPERVELLLQDRQRLFEFERFNRHRN